MTDEDFAKLREDFNREMDESVARAQAAPEMKPEEIYDNLYV